MSHIQLLHARPDSTLWMVSTSTKARTATAKNLLRHHTYEVAVEWVGNTGEGTVGYKAYSRAHEIRAEGKPSIPGSSDPSFRGDRQKWNPEELLVAALATCHQLWYLHLCARDGIVVTAYEDRATGVMVEHADGGGEFIGVTLRPRSTISPPYDRDHAIALHQEAHRLCFIARSVRCPIEIEPTISGNRDEER